MSAHPRMRLTANARIGTRAQRHCPGGERYGGIKMAGCLELSHMYSPQRPAIPMHPKEAMTALD